MASRRRPPDPSQQQQDLINALRDNVNAVQGVRLSINQLRSRASNLYNPITELTEVFRNSEKLQLQAAAIGSSYSRFLKSNTEVMEGLSTNQQELTRVLLKSFDSGLRDVTRATMELADDMFMTGQTTDSLIKLMASVRLVTANSREATSNLAKTITKTTERTNVSQGKLVESLNKAADSMSQFAIYGPGAVQGISNLTLALKGGLAGNEKADVLINQITKTLDPLNMSQQALLGTLGFTKDLLNNSLSQEAILSKIVQVSESMKSTLSNDFIRARVMSEAIGKDAVTAFIVAGDFIKKMTTLTAAERASQEERAKTLLKFEQEKRSLFTKYAPEMHRTITTFLPQIAFGLLGIGLFRGAGGYLTTTGIAARRATATMQQRAARQAATAAGATRAQARTAGSQAYQAAMNSRNIRMIAGTALSFLGPIGLVAGMGVLFWDDIKKAIFGIEDEAERGADIAEEEARARRERDARITEMQALISVVNATVARANALGAQANLAPLISETNMLLREQLVPLPAPIEPRLGGN